MSLGLSAARRLLGGAANFLDDGCGFGLRLMGDAGLKSIVCTDKHLSRAGVVFGFTYGLGVSPLVFPNSPRVSRQERIEAINSAGYGLLLNVYFLRLFAMQHE